MASPRGPFSPSPLSAAADDDDNEDSSRPASLSPAPLRDDNDDAADAADAAAAEERQQPVDIPLTLTASTVLRQLPRDATAALAAAAASYNNNNGLPSSSNDKVVVRFKPVGSAPPLPGSGGGGGNGNGDVRRKIRASQPFGVVVAFVRRALRVPATASVFLYVNAAFAPALDEVVGNLHQCFKDANDQLNVSYSLTPAFG
ncbi:Autophagy-related protein 12 [Niveomyces insectorum RCEF 264]|uniref:Ubiquitin-like protein ATG12 n=1 Tax=Niveomyces insectorum RCEF 264 TaxID=1081102 RepID=A0A167VI11_9HYPO|nr:Autophagy-related protein 12 [Niveomyces insectorum RCEF 264]